ncbi:MAG: TIGR02757 family protein [Bacteroidales bacterium]|nr:MAG: TIGR02757 family protein [Bacteroidales bacterium]
MNPILDKIQLKDFLEEKYRLYATPKFIEDDPIQIPHRYSQKEDIEIAGLLTSTLAWGTRKMIIYNIDRLLAKFGDSPYEFIMDYSQKDDYRFKGFVHRTFNENDCLYYIRVLNYIYSFEGGLEKAFSLGYQNDLSIMNSIDSFRRKFIFCNTPIHTLKHIPNVLNGSAAKRINMFLRWMVRPSSEGVDFGIWKSIPTSALMMPLDTHSGRVARALGLLNRNQNDWKSVDELTTQVREFDGNDPVKYDFALFGLGVNEKFGA